MFDFTVAADTAGSVFFQDDGADNVGAVLDYVRITTDAPAPVPVPAAGLLLLGGLGGLGMMRKRRG